MTKIVKYRLEQFTVSKPTNCAMLVTHESGATAAVSVKGSNYVIQTSRGTDNGQLYAPGTNVVEAACQRILDFMPDASELLCERMDHAYEQAG